MTKEEFMKLDFLDKVNYLNLKLKNGYTVAKIRESIGIGEKALQRDMKINGYVYSNKYKQYVSATTSTTKTTTCDLMPVVVQETTCVVDKAQEQMLSYFESNFDVIKEFIEKYKSATSVAPNNNIIINLIDDRHLTPKPKSIRINEFVYRDWQKFCEKMHYSKQDLISMALKEYIQKYDE